MFIRVYCALLFFLSLASALDVSAPLLVHPGTSVKLDVDTVSGDPSHIGLLLCVSDGSFDINLATDVAVEPTIEVNIPSKVHPRTDYFIAAIQPRNSGIIYSKSNLFEIEHPRRGPKPGNSVKLRPERLLI